MKSSSQPSGSTSQSLIARLKSRDPIAWERLVELYGPLVYHWCRQCGLSGDDASDLVQETFARVSTAIDSFRRDRETDSFRGWLWTIARNIVRDHARKNADRAPAAGGTEMHTLLQQIPENAAPPNDEPGIHAYVMHRALEIVRAEFNETSWKAFQLMTFQGLTSSEAASQLAMTPEAVRKAKSRIFRRLREEVGDAG